MDRIIEVCLRVTTKAGIKYAEQGRACFQMTGKNVLQLTSEDVSRTTRFTSH